MSSLLKKIQDYPDVSFIEETGYTDLQEQMIRDYEKKYQEITGKAISLAQADPFRLILYSCAVAVYQGYQYVDRAGKMGLLKYGMGSFLDHLAALKGVTRNEAVPATAMLRFTLSAPASKDAVIPAGIRVKGYDLYFETEEPGVIPAGMLKADIPVRCMEAGEAGNGLIPGDIHTLVDPLPYTLAVKNITESSGGADREGDKELAERVYLAPSSHSTAGATSAYEYWVKTFSPLIGECQVISEAPGEVDIYVVVDGEVPTDDFTERLQKYLDRSEIRPLTDKVVVKKPETIPYEVNFTYYIRRSDQDMEGSIKEAVETACRNYIDWQKAVGRDITPAHLVYEVMQAGAQSVDVTEPAYMELGRCQMAVAADPVIIYGGLRDG